MVEARREIIIKLRDKQRQAVRKYYSNRPGPLHKALELPDTLSVHMKLTPAELSELLAEVERDYEGARGKPGQGGMLLNHGLFTIRNTLALCQMYGITGDEL